MVGLSTELKRATSQTANRKGERMRPGEVSGMVLKMPAIAARNANFAAADGANGLAAQRHQREEALRLGELKGEKEGCVEVGALPRGSELFGSPQSLVSNRRWFLEPELFPSVGNSEGVSLHDSTGHNRKGIR